MTKINRISTGIAWLIVLSGMLAVGSGCNTRGAINASGGLSVAPQVNTAGDQWLKDIKKFKADALVTHYDENGNAELSRQVINVNIDMAQITADCELPSGSWWGRNALGPIYNPWSWGVVFRWYLPMAWGDLHSQSLSTMDLMLHRIRGPLNLASGEKVAGITETFAGGYSTWRLQSKGSPLASAYFFDKATGTLRMVSTGGLQATEDGTITVYRTGFSTGGSVIPTGFDVMEIGDNSIIGSRMLMSVKFENIVTQ